MTARYIASLLEAVGCDGVVTPEGLNEAPFENDVRRH